VIYTSFIFEENIYFIYDN